MSTVHPERSAGDVAGATHKALPSLPLGNAICYSGYRRGQSPDSGVFPDVAQIRQDLHLLARHWKLLRLYDCSLHAQRVLQVIRDDALDLRVMLGAYLGAEVNNPGCPWGKTYTDDELQRTRLAALCTQHPDIIFAAAVGNECTVGWTDHLVPLSRMIDCVRTVRTAVRQPVTFCENYVPWLQELGALAAELDFISVHTYPVWEYKGIHEALAYTKDNVDSVARLYPNKPVVISEAGWTTRTNGRGIPPEHTSEALQQVYYGALMDWARGAGILTFVFEAFDEPWKGSADPLEPEKHWGLFTVDRQPKQVLWELYSDLRPPPSA